MDYGLRVDVGGLGVSAGKQETRPDPNNEQQRTFQLAMRHRAINERYERHLGQLNQFVESLAQVLDLPMEADGAVNTRA